MTETTLVTLLYALQRWEKAGRLTDEQLARAHRARVEIMAEIRPNRKLEDAQPIAAALAAVPF